MLNMVQCDPADVRQATLKYYAINKTIDSITNTAVIFRYRLIFYGEIAGQQRHIDCIFIDLRRRDQRSLSCKFGSRQGFARDPGMDIKAQYADYTREKFPSYAAKS
jgi:hypothetical protein